MASTIASDSALATSVSPTEADTRDILPFGPRIRGGLKGA
jgi:hypothetical protein